MKLKILGIFLIIIGVIAMTASYNFLPKLFFTLIVGIGVWLSVKNPKNKSGKIKKK